MRYSLEYKGKRKIDKKKYIEKFLNENLPYKFIDEYGDFINNEIRNVVRTNCLRRYLEEVIAFYETRESLVIN